MEVWSYDDSSNRPPLGNPYDVSMNRQQRAEAACLDRDYAVITTCSSASWQDLMSSDPSRGGCGMKVTVDLNKCKGEGRCYEIAIDVFERGPDGKSVVLVAEIDADDSERCVQAGSAEMMCPSAAITVEAG